MPELRPFRGILYNPRRLNVQECVAPPYDVISPELQAELYTKHPANIVRLILGREPDRYEEAASTFAHWRREGIVLTDGEPALYVVSQRFALPSGIETERTGFIAACRLEEFGHDSIYPHEKTLAGPKEDRFRLFQATRAMFSQIFSIYADTTMRVDSCLSAAMAAAPALEVEYESVRTRLWKLTDPDPIRTIADEMRSRAVFVADGHHRYETALLYRDSVRLKDPSNAWEGPHEYVPMFFTNMDHPGLLVLPTHRIVHSLPGFDAASFIERLKGPFQVERTPSVEKLLGELPTRGEGALGLVVASGWFLVTPNDRQSLFREPIPGVLAALDVTVLHSAIFRDLLGMTEEDQAKKRFLDYVKDPEAAVRRVAEGKAQAAFLMNATPVRQVRDVAQAGYTMPQKSTYFYPKLLSGLVIYSFEQF